MSQPPFSIMIQFFGSPENPSSVVDFRMIMYSPLFGYLGKGSFDLFSVKLNGSSCSMNGPV